MSSIIQVNGVDIENLSKSVSTYPNTFIYTSTGTQLFGNIIQGNIFNRIYGYHDAKAIIWLAISSSALVIAILLS